VLSWLVTERLATADAEVSWYLEKQQGPNSCAALLTELGWRAVDRHREGKLVRIVGSPPERADLPEPRRFSAVLGSAELSFAADYGVFSPGHVDEGTMLLAEVALRHPPVDALADIGVGYGPLAVGLLRNGVAERAVGTDVDCLALWLAERNAGHNGVAIRTVCSPDPRDVELTPLTVCNVPTHIDAARSAELMTALAQRAGGGRDLMVVVHASLERRYTRHLVDAGLAPTRQPGAAHVVLTATG
jgi:16S rRNA G1207 methylase RsmC